MSGDVSVKGEVSADDSASVVGAVSVNAAAVKGPASPFVVAGPIVVGVYVSSSLEGAVLVNSAALKDPASPVVGRGSTVVGVHVSAVVVGWKAGKHLLSRGPFSKQTAVCGNISMV